jgi:hypothetical protein
LETTDHDTTPSVKQKIDWQYPYKWKALVKKN